MLKAVLSCGENTATAELLVKMQQADASASGQ
jgi:hypothetical protein